MVNTDEENRRVVSIRYFPSLLAKMNDTRPIRRRVWFADGTSHESTITGADYREVCQQYREQYREGEQT